MQMGISVSHSSSPNWHLTAAPHGLLAGCVSARSSRRRKQQRRIKHHPAERALSPAPFTPFTPSPPSPFPSLAAISRGKQFAPQTARSAHYRFSQSACRSEIHPSSPLLVAHLHLHLHLLPAPPALPLWKHEEDVRILKMFCIRALSQKETAHTADIWPRFQNLIFI